MKGMLPGELLIISRNRLVSPGSVTDVKTSDKKENFKSLTNTKYQCKFNNCGLFAERRRIHINYSFNFVQKELKIYYSLVCICRLHACILDLCSIINLANSIFISWYILWVFIVISPTLPSCQTINSDIWSLCPHLQPSLNNFSRWWKQNLWELFRRPYYLISDRKRF